MILSVLFLSLFFSIADIKAQVVYGSDDRKDLGHSTPLNQKWAKSVAAMIKNEQLLSKDGGKTFEISNDLDQDGIDDRLGTLCEEERFRNQITPSGCTGFLVAPDIMVTAGHCVRNQEVCNTVSWAFGFDSEHLKGNQYFLESSHVYSCKKMIAQKYDPISLVDYAVVQLERKVLDRESLLLRKDGKIADQEALVVIGHSFGMPMKIADGAFVRKNDSDVFFSTNSDTFQGSSGSPVFNLKSGMVEGIMVRGEVDFEYDYTRNCFKVKVCKDDDCRGEDATRITLLNEILAGKF